MPLESTATRAKSLWTKRPPGNAPHIGSRFGVAGGAGGGVPLFGLNPDLTKLPRFPAAPPTSAEVTVVLPGAQAFPPPPAFPSSQAFPPRSTFPQSPNFPPRPAFPSLSAAVPPSPAFPPPPAFPSFSAEAPPSPSFPQPPAGVPVTVLQTANPGLPPLPQKGGGGLLGGVLSHLAGKVFQGVSGLFFPGGGGGIVGGLLKEPIAEAAKDIKEDANAGLRFASSELAFQGQQKAQGLATVLRGAARTAGRVGISQYRALLQKKDALKDLVADTAENVGAFADQATTAKYNKLEASLQAIGRLLRDLKVAFLDYLIHNGQAAKVLVTEQTEDNGEAVGAVLGAKREAMRDSVKAVAELVSGRKHNYRAGT